MLRRTGVVAALAAILLMAGPVWPAGAGQKTPRADGPALSTKFRDRLAAHEKTKSAAKSGPARLNAPAPAPARERALQFNARSAAGTLKRSAETGKGASWLDVKAHRASLPAAKQQGAPFEGRHGTGLGDIYEDEPNDSTAQIVDDLPVNIVGYANDDDDIDYFAITATGGESIRIEVVADRIFNTFLDSYVVVLADDGETVLDSNDDAFDGSSDSFIRFDAPYSGTRVYFVGVTDFGGLGGANYGYVLNVAVADSPDFNEVEPNDTTPFADFFHVPSVAFGFSDNSDDLDVYVFDGFANEALIVDVDAEVFLSDMDPVVELYDENGGFLFGVDDADGLDPRFNIVLPYTGTYYMAVYNRDPRGGNFYYYSMNLSTQSSALAPRVRAYRIIDGRFLKRVNGDGFVTTGGGSKAEINSELFPSRPAPRKPSTVVKLKPSQLVGRGDVITIVNPDGRRSNPGVIN